MLLSHFFGLALVVAVEKNGEPSPLAPLYREADHNRVADSFIVVFKQDGDEYIEQHWQTIGMDLSSSEDFHCFSAISGYTASMVRDLLLIYFYCG